MEEIYVNDDNDTPEDKRPSTYKTGSRRFHRAVVLFLGLLSVLLLAGLIGCSTYCHISTCDSSAELSAIKASLTRQRDLLNVSLAEMTQELQCLKKMCPTGWKKFSCSCYLFSTQKNSWEESRQDCRARGADLVVIRSLEEQQFVTDVTKQSTWVGLSDRDHEGTWKWTDDTPLTLSFWQKGQPDNGGGDPIYGKEDCCHISLDGTKTEVNWNDLACQNPLFWICEKYR
ncbi:CD209 antigen-like protein E isoform X2 [Notolabrus celidotus]|uniref:CD209 antigen-like protein E isoform X2 n=1 Tax=Notolabrus celidotus TaxID=1203425 RepID=UPI00148FC17A|nr:CD209 antigen-like protein E isoform X2 [Notolabrus celidotus]